MLALTGLFMYQKHSCTSMYSILHTCPNSQISVKLNKMFHLKSKYVNFCYMIRFSSPAKSEAFYEGEKNFR